ncbi:hypothetical protein, variant [Capsaspora owczarzaki ATCC 30864]|nr:hypothetical protein, variant [Capsaspora owczarzaki ATCC 30864]
MCDGMLDRYLAPMAANLRHTTLDAQTFCELFNYCIVFNTTQEQLGNFPAADSAKDRRWRRLAPSLAKVSSHMGQLGSTLYSMASDLISSVVARLSSRWWKSLGQLASPKPEPEATTGATPTHQPPVSRNTTPRRPSLQNIQSHRRLPSVTRKTTYSPNNTVRLLQLTDIHLDLAYEPGSPTNCDVDVCCHAYDVGSGRAGYFGNSNCNLPERTLKSLFAYLNATFAYPGNPFQTGDAAPNGQIDAVLWTGNNAPEQVWDCSWNRTLTANTRVANLFRQFMPSTPVFPVIGPHDTYPGNLFDYDSDQYILDAYTELWSLFLNSSALSDVAKFGAYSAVLRPGLRILVSNSYQSVRFNYYAAVQKVQRQITQQVVFFTKILTDAISTGERIVLVGNLPPGVSEALPNYGAGAVSYVSSSPSSFALMTFGYTHFDSFEVLHKLTAGNATQAPALILDEPVHVVFTAPSLSPNGKRNPAFRVYTLDATSFELLDHETFYFNLEKANSAAAALPVPASEEALDAIAQRSWDKLYAMKETYDMPDMSPHSYCQLSKSILRDQTVANVHNTLMQSSNVTIPCPLETCGVSVYCATQFAVFNYDAGCVVGLVPQD